MDYRRIVIEAGKRMQVLNLTVGTFGNISVCDRKNSAIYVTPSGLPYDTLTPEDIVVLDMEGNVIEGHRKPSVEKDLHVKLYEARPEINAVLHTHPIYSSAFACMNKEIPMFYDEAVMILKDTVRVAEYAPSGTIELAENCVEAIGDTSMACMLRSHGSVSIAKTMEGCFDVASILEMVAQIYLHILSSGGEYSLISTETIQNMQSFAENEYGQ